MSETKEALALNKTRVWNPVALKWICIFLSFYSGITLYIINFYRLKHHKRHKNTFIGISILLTVSVISFITPDHTLVSLLLLLTNVSVAAYFNYQQKELYSVGWIFGVLILLSLFLVYFVINFYITYI
ncbi:MAG: hypothetical protein K0R50_4434 [Eubacterium sp.]|nr:hypothetical protein [Eubacterium sp.]